MYDSKYKFNNSQGTKRAPSMSVAEYADIHNLKPEPLRYHLQKAGIEPIYSYKKKMNHIKHYAISTLNQWRKDNVKTVNKIKLEVVV